MKQDSAARFKHGGMLSQVVEGGVSALGTVLSGRVILMLLTGCKKIERLEFYASDLILSNLTSFLS